MWARSRSTRARWNSSSGPASAVANSPRAASNAPAWKLACAAASARSARRAGSCVSATARCRNAAAAARPPRACARPAERSSSSGDLLVGSRRGRSQMPRTTIGVDLAIGHLRQRPWTADVRSHDAAPIHRRAHQRMTEHHPLADRQQPVRLRGFRGRRPDPEPLGRTPEQQRIADRLRRREQQQPPRVAQASARVVERSSPRSVRSAPAPPAAQTHRPAGSPSTRAAARATPAGCRASRR